MPDPNPQPQPLPQPKRCAGDKVEARGEIQIEVDGYYYWFPSGGGGLSAWELRSIADKLDSINKDWDDEVHRVLSDD
jgi:hypothetical protein